MSDANAASAPPRAGAIGRALVLAYGVVAYVGFLAIFLYVIGFVMGFGVPKTIDQGVTGTGMAGALLNVLILGVFGVQHTIMARPAFKRWFTRFVPEPIERSTFVLLTNLILTWLVVAWRPFPVVVWQVDGVAAMLVTLIAVLGWVTVLVSTCLIDHFELFGLKQSVAYALGRPIEPAQFRERFLYKYVRHPLMLGFLIAFWAAPTMTVGHLLFAGVTTAYVLVALVIEERTLVELHGDAYEDYRRRVPKLLPFPRRA
jgi:protein-S-isoprenylcysteine O-methyltransferase Ste14